MAHAGLLSRSRAARNNQYQFNPSIYTQVWLHSPDKRYLSYCPTFASELQGFRVLGKCISMKKIMATLTNFVKQIKFVHALGQVSIHMHLIARTKTNLLWWRPRTNLNDQCQNTTYFYYNISPNMVAPLVAATIWRLVNGAQAIVLASVSKTSTLSPEHPFVSRKLMWLSADS